jgi:ATP-dependent helicase/nuclease subunit A
MSDKPTLAQQQAANPQQSVWVSASAGTGKTRVLVNRMLRLMLAGGRPEKLLCITFTKAAAAEVLERIQHVVLKWSIQDETTLANELAIVLDQSPSREEIQRARRLLPIILQSPGGIKIMTIHAFCQSVLARFPLEANVSPGFAIADEAQSQSLLTQAKYQLLEDTTAENDPELFANLSRFFDRLDEKNQNSIIQNVLLKRYRLSTLLDAHGNDLSKIKETVCQIIGLSLKDLAINHETAFLQDIPVTDIRALIPELHQGKGATPLKYAAAFQAWIDTTPSLRNYIDIFLTKSNTIAKNLHTGLDKSPAWVHDLLDKEANRAFDYLQRQNKIDLAKDTIALLHICLEIIAHYQNLKHLNSVLDYEDQILLTSQLLKDPLSSQWVHYKLDGGIDHILVDEAQDTSPAQWDIIEGITSDFFNGSGIKENGERSLFVVGDEKQSIFSFQNADPVAFSKARHSFAEKAAIGKTPWQDISLIDNFRSAPLVLQLTDQVFKDRQLAAYISQDAQDIQHQGFHTQRPGQIELWPLVPLAEGDAYSNSPEFILSETIATQAQKLIGQRLSNGKVIRPGDIMILVRKRTPLVGPLTKAFKDRNIPVTSADRLILKDQLAVQDCLMALQCCLNQDDDYALACFLKSPFIGISEEDLYALSIGREGSLWNRFIHSDHPAVSYVQSLAESVTTTLPGHFIHALLSQSCPAESRSGRHALVQRLGYDCDDVLDELLLTAYDFEENHNAGAQGFVTWMQNNQSVIKRASSELDKSRVQIMTVHASKGLQAPIVFLADSNTKPGIYRSVQEVIWNDNTRKGFLWGMGDATDSPVFEQEKLRYTELQFSEYYRLLYVAMTRAEERLVVCGWQPKRATHKEFPSWYDSITNAVHQLQNDERYMHRAVKFFKQDGIYLEQKGQVKPDSDEDGRSADKQYIPQRLLDLPPEETSRPRPLRPSRPPEQEPSVFSPLQPARKDPYKRGQILHSLFRLIPDYPLSEQQEALDNLLKHHIEDAAEQTSMAKEIMSVLRDPTFAHLFTPNAKAEVPIVGEVELDGQSYAMSGQIDRLLIEEDRVLIVDYKTNRPPVLDEAKIPAAYRYQLRAYKALMQKIYPDKKIETALLWTSIPYLLPVSG